MIFLGRQQLNMWIGGGKSQAVHRGQVLLLPLSELWNPLCRVLDKPSTIHMGMVRMESGVTTRSQKGL